MYLTLPKIYPITDTGVSGLSHVEQVRRLIAGGATMIQLRDKTASPRDFYAASVAAIDVARKHDVKIIVNDRADIALAAQADGVHLGQDDMPPRAARAVLGENAIIGYSTHSLAQAVAAAQLPVNYIAIGPIFPTKTKEAPDDIVGIEGIEVARKAIGSFPLVAIGGITSDSLSAVFAAGADSVAVISDILTDTEAIEQRFRYLSDFFLT